MLGHFSEQIQDGVRAILQFSKNAKNGGGGGGAPDGPLKSTNGGSTILIFTRGHSHNHIII